MNKIKTSAFARLIGNWTTSGDVKSEDEHLKLTGTDSYQFILDGAYILHKADVMMGDKQSETFEVIGYDSNTSEYTMRYFDNTGNSGTMTATIDNDVWTFHGEKLRFTGGFKKEDQEFSGIWEQLTDGNKWIHYMSVQLTRQ